MISEKGRRRQNCRVEKHTKTNEERTGKEHKSRMSEREMILIKSAASTNGILLILKRIMFADDVTSRLMTEILMSETEGKPSE